MRLVPGILAVLWLALGGAAAQTTTPTCPDTHVPCGGACCAK